MNRCYAFSVLLLLTGCAQFRSSIDSPDELFFRPPVGTVVELRQDLRVAPQRTRVFIQSGSVLGSGGINTYHPSCNFELRDLSPEPQVISAGNFTIERVRLGSESVVRAGTLQLASLRLAGYRHHSDSQSIMRYYHFSLHSEQQPQVMRLTCRGGLDDSPKADYPTWPEIQQALGTVVGFILP